jgi:hypothetical protein
MVLQFRWFEPVFDPPYISPESLFKLLGPAFPAQFVKNDNVFSPTMTRLRLVDLDAYKTNINEQKISPHPCRHLHSQVYVS